MFSASVSFPNKKDMDAFIAAFTRAKASLSPLSTASAGGIPVTEGAAGGGANAAVHVMLVAHHCQGLQVAKREFYHTC
jgi:hypothetical protein